MELISYIITLIGILFFLYFSYRIFRVVRPFTSTFLLQEDGRFRQDGFVKFNRLRNRFTAFDLFRSYTDQLVGEIQVMDDGKAWVKIKMDTPDSSDTEYKPIGYIDLVGNIYDKNHFKIGYVGNSPGLPDMDGKRKWYELWLRCHAYVFIHEKQEQILSNASEGVDVSRSDIPTDICIGKCIETGRFRKRRANQFSMLGRAAAYLLLYQQNRLPQAETEETSVYDRGWADTALLSTVLFTILYTLFYFLNIQILQFPFLGEWSFVFASMLLYFCVWFIVRQVRIEMSLSGKPIGNWLHLFNCNIGIGWMNYLIFICALGSIIISGFISGKDFFPLQAAILIGIVATGRFIPKTPWIVYEKFLPKLWGGEEDEDTDGLIIKMYEWDLDSDEANLEGRLELYFAEEEIVALRSRNPFRTQHLLGFDRNIEQLFREKVNERHLTKINRYIFNKANEANISELDTMQFILDFVQEPNISYLADADSPETGNIEYARFPVETLFDKRGDCDCKAVLAAALFRNAGYRVAYLTSQGHAMVAVACPEKWFKNYHISQMFLEEKNTIVDPEGRLYYLCETTSDSFRIGDCGEGIKPEDFKKIRYLK